MDKEEHIMYQHVPPQPPRKRKKGHPVLIATGITAGAIFTFLMGALVGSAGGGTTEAASTTAPTVTSTVAGPVVTKTEPGPTVTKTVQAKPKGPSATIPGDGTFKVGSEVKPGTYRAKPDPSGVGTCYWARLRSANEESIITNHIGSGPTFVTIRPSDGYFETTGCGTWTRA